MYCVPSDFYFLEQSLTDASSVDSLQMLSEGLMEAMVTICMLLSVVGFIGSILYWVYLKIYKKSSCFVTLFMKISIVLGIVAATITIMMCDRDLDMAIDSWDMFAFIIFIPIATILLFSLLANKEVQDFLSNSKYMPDDIFEDE